ncbi:MAG: polysaccharide deacetylase family protein [Deltaproteobacteria bacterium]|nr:polysaccharide deacetylase family protein [Deltaproteobacteria bacterium]
MTMIAIMSCQRGGTGAAASTPSSRSIKSDCPTADSAIVTLTYDDNLQSQLANAVPMLNAHNMRGTFFLNDVTANVDAWKDVRAGGHELGSHTTYHPCTAQFDWVEKGNASEDYTLERMAEELDDQISMLKTLGETAPFSFAYPCGTTWIGSEQTSYIPLIQKRFIAARGVTGDIVTRLDDPMNVPAYFLEGPLEAFIGSANAAIADKGWVVFGFHGVGGDYLSVSNEDHNAFLDWLAERQDEVAVLPFRDAARCMLK